MIDIDVTDTGTIIGNIKPHQFIEPPPILVPVPPDGELDGKNADSGGGGGGDGSTSDNNNIMTIGNTDTTNDITDDDDDDEAIDEEEALRAIDKLRGDDLPMRIEAATKLSIIARALGPQRTREELLPFLSDSVDDDDEVLEAMASSLGNKSFIQHVGGTQYASSLLQPLEILLAVEENVVREKASASVIAISQQMKKKRTKNYDNADDGDDFACEFLAMIARLAQNEWFTARISACGLIPIAFSQIRMKNNQPSNNMQLEYISYFAAMCRDDTPMVRRMASRNLGSLLQTVVNTMGPSSSLGEHGVVWDVLLDLYESLAGGDQPDSVRLHTTQNCVMLGQTMSSIKEQVVSPSSSLHGGGGGGGGDGGGEEVLLRINIIVKRVLPLIVATIDDRSWRVRWTAASKFADVVHAYSSLDGTMDALVSAYEKLLQDPEAEVRTAATFNLSEVAKTRAEVYPAGWTGGGGGGGGDADSDSRRISVALRLVKRVLQLTEDDSENVRVALAVVATDMAPVLGKDATITMLLPPMLLLLRDSTSEVRLNIISSLSMLNEVIGAELLVESLLPAILDLAEDSKWRVRLAVIDRMPLLAKQLGTVFFTDRLLSLCVGWLGDDISSIREAAAKNLKELTALLGSEWAVKNLLPRVKEVMENQSYLRRMNAVQAISLMATVMDEPTAQWEILPILLEMHCDPVPNVRFNVAKGLSLVGPLFKSSMFEGQIVPILTLMIEDSDRDVRYFASKSFDSLNAFFDSNTV
jgi:serine/threonine-protein phosphatase 2A regulatory subunit A